MKSNAPLEHYFNTTSMNTGKSTQNYTLCNAQPKEQTNKEQKTELVPPYSMFIVAVLADKIAEFGKHVI
jgi:hypothetical protein